MAAYYNEIDPFAAEWLRRLILCGEIADGVVDTRSIEDVHPDDLRGFTQCHFFAGIGVWSYALRLAGWPDDRPVWTGSCPCQPFSQAGKGRGTDDERHLWPAWDHLIGVHRPTVVFGEQVASPAGLAWLDIVQADLEGKGYAVGAADLCAAGVGAPHIRQRLYFVAEPGSERQQGERLRLLAGESRSPGAETRRSSKAGELAESAQQLIDGRRARGARGRSEHSDSSQLGDTRGAGGGRDTRALSRAEGSTEGEVRSLADELELASLVGNTDDEGSQGRRVPGSGRSGERSAWSPSDTIWCRDGKWRPVEPGTFPLAHGAPARVGRLRAYGNALVAPLAAEFVRAYADLLD